MGGMAGGAALTLTLNLILTPSRTLTLTRRVEQLLAAGWVLAFAGVTQALTVRVRVRVRVRFKARVRVRVRGRGWITVRLVLAHPNSNPNASPTP